MSTTGNLNNVPTLLVTRPDHQAGQLIDLINSAGGLAYGFPSIEIRPTRNRSALLATIKTLPDCDYVFFISPNAVTHGIEAISGTIGDVPNTVKLAAIGAGTVAALETAGYQCQLSPKENFNSESLLALPALQDVKNKRVIIFRGNGGRNKLKNELSKRGAHVAYAECYERVIPGTSPEALINKLRNHNINIISFTSADAARNLVTMLGDNAELVFNLPVIVISQRISDVCLSLGFKAGIILAKSASNEAIVDSMMAWLKKK
ncbi:MAG: uroporphyrinogen-III synthase [Acidiferrobacterales bacterium]